MNAQEWNDKYLNALNTRCKEVDVDGLDGETLDALIALKDIDGEELTDYECLLLAEVVLRQWKATWNKHNTEEAKKGWGNI